MLSGLFKFIVEECHIMENIKRKLFKILCNQWKIDTENSTEGNTEKMLMVDV